MLARGVAEGARVAEAAHSRPAGPHEGNEPLRGALREAGLLLEGDPGASGTVAAVIDLGARDREELIALARQCYGPLVGVLPQDGDARLADGLDGFVRAPLRCRGPPPWSARWPAPGATATRCCGRRRTWPRCST